MCSAPCSHWSATLSINGVLMGSVWPSFFQSIGLEGHGLLDRGFLSVMYLYHPWTMKERKVGFFLTRCNFFCFLAFCLISGSFLDFSKDRQEKPL